MRRSTRVTLTPLWPQCTPTSSGRTAWKADASTATMVCETIGYANGVLVRHAYVIEDGRIKRMDISSS